MWFHKFTHFIWGAYERILWVLTGEFIFHWRANSAGVVVFRALLITGLVFLMAIGLVEVMEPGPAGDFSIGELANHVHDKVTWLGAIFAASYVALYTRFAGQWGYLAGLYNTFMATRLKTTPEEYAKAQHSFNLWRAGFIEDAEDMHLALKPTYAGVILSMLEKEGVWRCYKNGGEDAQKHLENLRKRLTRRLARNKYTVVGAEVIHVAGRGQAEELALGITADDDLATLVLRSAQAATKAAKAAGDATEKLAQQAEQAKKDLDAAKAAEAERKLKDGGGGPAANA